MIKPMTKTTRPRLSYIRSALAVVSLSILQAISIVYAESGQPPNIVFILADDMGYGDLSVLNPQSKITTTNLDRLAKEGMIFTDAHSGSSVCTPTRYGILTGRYCWRTRLKEGVLYNYSQSLMEPSRLTVASFLKQYGYSTAMVGKWHLGLDWASKSKPGEFTANQSDVDFTAPFKNGPVDMGFDSFFGICASLDMPPYVFLENNKATSIPTVSSKAFGRVGLADETLTPTDVHPTFVRKAVSYIEEQDPKRPFFLYLPLASPHTPIVPSKGFRGKSGLKGKLGEYADFCIEVDDTVGQVLTALEKKGLGDNTMVMFTADNGTPYYIGASQFETQGHSTNGIFRGYKGGTYDGGHRVPFLVRWPKAIKSGTKNEQTICLTDLMATCADIVGKPLPENAGEDSLSFLAAMRGEAIDTTKREAVVHHDFGGHFAIRKGRWKFLEAGTMGIQAGKNKDWKVLFDMESDPGETKNLSEAHPQIVKELIDLLEKYKRDGRSVQLQ